MTKHRRRLLLWGLGALAAVLLVVYAMRPVRVSVDVAEVGRGMLRVVVEEEGKTRIREVFKVSAPVAGKVLRAPLEVGDKVVQGETVVAVIEPEAPSFLDARTRRTLEAQVAASEAALLLADAHIRQARSALQFAQGEEQRAQRLVESQNIPEQLLERAVLDRETREAELSGAQAERELRAQELNAARVRLLGPEARWEDAEDCCIRVPAPVSGNVLRIWVESAQVVLAGESLLEIGDPRDLEVAVELLSADAVRVQEGALAFVEGWGGAYPLRTRLERIEPAAFTKVSALGIEEQRVNTVLKIIDPPQRWQALGHEYRVYARIVVWEGQDVLQVPLGALFRGESGWAVFQVEGGRAHLRRVEIGQRNARAAQILSGLEEGDTVLLHPSDQIEDGVRIVAHPGGA